MHKEAEGLHMPSGTLREAGMNSKDSHKPIKAQMMAQSWSPDKHSMDIKISMASNSSRIQTPPSSIPVPMPPPLPPHPWALAEKLADGGGSVSAPTKPDVKTKICKLEYNTTRRGRELRPGAEHRRCPKGRPLPSSS